jgi:pyrroline-5-carboxylate reductase
MLCGWRDRGLAHSFAVDPAMPPSPGKEVTVVADAKDIPTTFNPEAIVIAVKPQVAAETLPRYSHYSGSPFILSIMAGRTISGIRGLVGERMPIVRAMPNTPAAVGMASTVACADPSVTDEQRALCHLLLAAIGSVSWVEEETLLDPVTAVSGSGPAYVFLLAELMERAAIEQGIPPDLARKLARETVAGSGKLLAESPEDAGQLRENVTSPGGTTAAALSVLMDQAAMPDLVSRAIAAATRRSRELAG